MNSALDLVADRYRVKRELGRGGMSIVLEAEDAWTGRKVALKLGRADVPRARERLAYELELVRGIEHPHLMRVLESCELTTPPPEVASLALVLELYAYPSALEWAPGRDPRAIAGVGARIATALAALHALGVRHGDVSPPNIRVAANGDCKLIDFGLAGLGVGDATAGTVQVMAPEALAGRPSPASDVFALAMTLRAMLGSAASGPLAEALAAMTHDDAGRRADAAMAADLLGRAADPATATTLARLRDAPRTLGRAIGRDAELASLVPSPGATVRRRVISGPSGIGKSTLLGACATRALVRGYRVAGGVHSGAAGDLDVVLRALRTLGVSVELPRPSEEDAAAARYAMFTVIAEALQRRDEPTALLFDDVPEASPLDELGRFMERFASARVLWLQAGTEGELLAPLTAEAVRMVVHAARPLRTVDGEASAALFEAAKGHPATTVALLDAYPGDALLAAATKKGLTPKNAPELDMETRGALASVALFARGAPIAVLERCVPPAKLTSLTERGLAIQRSQATLEATRPAALEDLPEAVARRLVTELEGTTNGGEDYTVPLAHLALRLGDIGHAEQLALRGGTTAEREGHAPEALAVYDAVLRRSPSSALAAASARVLLALGRPSEAIERMRHAPGHSERRIIEADAFISLGRYGEAAERLAAPAEKDEPGPRIVATRARALMLAGRYADARALAEEALAREASHPRRVDLLNVAGVCCFYTGHPERARALLDEAVAQATDARTSEASRANLALVLHKSGDLRAAESAYQRCIADLEARRDLPRKLLRLTNLAILRQEIGSFGAALASYSDAAELARLTANERALARVLLNHANLLAWLGASQEARTLLEEAVKASERTGLAVERNYLRLIAAELAIDANALADAERELIAAERAFAATGDRAGVAEAAIVRALALGRGGRAEEAVRSARSAVDEAVALQRPRLELRGRVVMGIVGPADQADASAAEPSRALSAADPDLAWMALALEARAAESRGAAREAREHIAHAQRHLAAVRATLPAHYEEAYRSSWWRSALLAAVDTPPAIAPAGISRDVERLLAINRELARDHDPERLLERIIDAAIALSGAERGFLLLSPADPKAELEVRTARGLDARQLASDELHISRSIARQVIDSNAPLSAIDAQHDQRFRDYQSVHSLKLRSVLCLPLRTGNAALGAIYLDHRYRASAFTDTDVALLAAFGDQAAIAIANARLMQQLADRAAELEGSRAAIDELNQRLGLELAAREAELDARKQGDADVPKSRHGMIGRTAAMREVFRVLDRVADKDVPVTVSGESGTGKELVARALHAGSARRGPFVPVNCGAIPEALLESELFGHERGAFTGAVRAKPGLFEIARSGTIFLDEIGDMPLGMQVKLLRVLQTREFRRVGGTVDLASDARVVSATNRNLEELVRKGGFREDLWYRLNVVEIRMPALRERRDDLPLLIEHLLGIHARGREVKLSRKAMAQLLDYAWPGNVRELDNELQRAIALAEGVIEPDDLSAKLQGRSEEEEVAGSLKMARDRHERDVIRAALAEHRRVSAAARALGLTRAGLYKKMHKLGLTAPDRD